MSQGHVEGTQEQQSQESGPLREQAGRMAGALRDMGSTVSDAAAQAYQSGREKAVQWEQQVEQFIREQPFKAVLIAAGVGLALGVLWKRR